MTALRVVVGVVEDVDGRVLVAERDLRRHQGGRAEFPGGKRRPQEPPESALRRELREELGIDAGAVQPLMRVRHHYPDRSVELDAYLVRDWSGEPLGAEGQPLDWATPEALDPERFPSANRPIIAALQLPPTCAITPGPDRVADVEALVDGTDRLLAGAGPTLVQLRRPEVGSDPWWRTLRALAGRVEAVAGARLLVNADPGVAASLPPGVGLHLSAAAARSVAERPVTPDRLLGCSCHDAAELDQAERLGADLVLLGPLGSTPSHPGARPLGWAGLAALAAATPLPIYALGGVGPGDLGRARANGAVGVAGIRGFWPGPDAGS